MIVCESGTAVVILSYKSIAWHKLFLPKIIEQAASGYDVVVVDHASPDNTTEYIQREFPSVKLISLQENHGFAWGYARALEQITAKYYVLLSSDFEVTDNWFPPLLAAMEQYPSLAACQPKIRFWKERASFEYAGAAGGFMDKWGYMFCRGRIFNTLEKDHHQYDDDIEVFWASGGCLMVHAERYHEVGGLDADLFAHMEEIDLCWRLKNAGYKIGAIGSSTVFHVGGSIISYGSPQKTYFNFRNNLVILTKNERTAKLLWLIPLRLVLDGVACLPFLLKGDVKNIFAVAKAHFHYYGSLRKWLKKRKVTRKLAIRPNTTGIYPHSIVQQYFLQKKDTFDKINFPTTTLS
ncbi:glycosyltransferase family 2 protein [Taibaiella sp. KBW10]|uniref:glycosyltransferase family 2 protein n=1 Tax=Taibaiella sp. KBW10 TaxID=2153357 RepID=UPI00131528E8|nr:glycosyltransferase family 2 protein [Taibaiella sp. KBW10]